MEKKVENDGCYVEVDAKNMVNSVNELVGSEMCVLKMLRFEFGGDDKDLFITRMNSVLKRLQSNGSLDGLSDEQCSFLLLKHMLIDG